MFFLSKKKQKKTFFYILDRKECFLDQQRKVLKNSKESTFCKGVSSWFLSKNLPFPYIFFFLAKNARKQHFLIIWIENKAFCTSKVKFSNSKRKSTFCKGVSPWFLSKNRPFSHRFFLSKKRQKERFLIFWIEKNAFLTTKDKC